jgi:hypothetical protein
MKKCLTFLAVKEMQIKTAQSLHLTPVKMTIIKKTNNDKYWQESKHAYIVERNTIQYRNQYGGSSKS